MAADVVSGSDSPNSCCTELKKKFLELKEGRNALRKAVKLLQDQTNKLESANKLLVDEKDKLESENRQLKKACEEERVRGDQETEAKLKESSIRNKLEKGIQDLKAETSSYQKNGNLRDVDEEENVLLRSQILEKEAEIKQLRELLEKEKKRSDSEKRKAEVEKTKSAEAWRLVKAERSKAEEERRRAESEIKNAEECRLWLEKVKNEANEVREKWIAERSKADDTYKKVEAEKQKGNREKNRADMERKKAEEQRRLTEAERKKTMDEKARADQLYQKLVEEKQGREELQKKLEETLSSGTGRCCSCFRDGKCNSSTNIETTAVKLLREQLKLEKKKVKHGKRMVKLGKAEKKFMKQEVHLLKQDLVKVLSRFNIFDGHLSCSIEGTDGMAKIGRSSQFQGFYLEDNPFSSKKCNLNSRNDFGLRNTCCNDALNSTRACSGLGLSGGSCTRQTSGTESELDSLTGVPIITKLQNSAVCSTTSSFSDRKFMGSQGRDALAISKLAKSAKSSNQRSNVPKPSVEVTKALVNEKASVAANDTDKSYIQRDPDNAFLSSSFPSAVQATDQVCDHNRKKRKIQDTLESLEWLYSEYNHLHLKIGEELSALNDNCLDDRRGLLTEKYNSLLSRYFGPSRNWKADKQQKHHLQPFHQIDNQKQVVEVVNEGNKAPSFLADSLKPHQVGENAHMNMEELNKDVNLKRDSFVYFENMICGDYVKVLDLEDDADEKKYRRATEMPLSPTLPEIEFPGHQLCLGDDSFYLIEGLNRGVGTEREDSMTRHDFDVIDLEIASKAPRMRVLDTPQELVLCHSQVTVQSMKEQVGNVTVSQSCVKQHDMSHGIAQRSFLMNHDPSDVEMTCNCLESNNFLNTVDTGSSFNELIGIHGLKKPLVSSLSYHDTISDSKACDGVVSGDKMLVSENTAQNSAESMSNAKPLPEDEVTTCCSLGIEDMEDSSSPQANEPSKTLVYTQVSNDDDWKENGSIIAQTINNEMVDNQIRSSMDTDSTTKMEETPSHTVVEIADPCIGNGAPEPERTANYCVLFGDTKDEDSISRIVHARNAFLDHKFIISQPDFMIAEILRSSVLEQDLQPKEKVSVFFSLLLCNVSARMPANSNSYVVGDCLACSGSFAAEINRVISNAETRWFFQEICQLDILVSLIEDFLISRKVLMYIHGLDEPWCSCISSGNYNRLGGENLYVSCRAATLDQFMSGCIILASVCAGINYIGFLLETSYKILRLCWNETSWNLAMLHVFSSICGKRFFDLDGYSVIITAIRSVVLLLEKGREQISSFSPCLNSACDMRTSFPPCVQCPFVTDAVCVDKLISLLLDVLHDCARNAIRCTYMSKSDTSINTIPTSADKLGESLEHESELPCQNISCSLSCFKFSYINVSSNQSDCFTERILCYFIDIASLVELIGCFMSWEWIYSKVISRLLEILESCKSEGFSSALFVLIGQLARFSIDVGGYQQAGIAELAYTLSVLFDTNVLGKRKLPTQLAAVGALLHFLPLRFEEIIGEGSEFSWNADHFGLVKSLRKWFFQLDREQQSSALGLFGYPDV